jgi:hypothetical protein
MSYDDSLMHPPRAQKFLSSHLLTGTITLFIGAGTSIGLGLPNWEEYVQRLRNKVGLDPIIDHINSNDLQLAANEVMKKCNSKNDYLQLLKLCLYDGINLSTEILKNDLYIALGGLLVSSKRGNIKRIVTLNFDSMLEWFFSLYGFVVRVIYSLPELEGSEDIRIYHPHGFLPHPSLKLTDSDFAIFDLNSVNERLGKIGDPWHEMTRYLLRSSICLFVGLSEKTFFDTSLASLLVNCGKDNMEKRVTGIWLLKGDTISTSRRSEFLDNNVIPIVFKTEKEIADFLLGICHLSAIKVRI